MPESLVIVESPAKAKTISKFLGRGYRVLASVGHVRDLPKSQFGVDVSANFTPRYITIRGKGKVIKELKEAARNSSRVLLATDPDREGEAISWHLAQVLGLDEDAPCRIEFHEITRSAVKESLKHVRPINDDLVNAQQARRILDRVVGYELSPFLWQKVRRGLSAGRVQSAALRIICDREREIRAFRPEEYWTIDAVLRTHDTGSRVAAASTSFVARVVRKDKHKLKLSSQADADAAVRELAEETYQVLEIQRRERRRSAAPPFTTSSLQQEAWRKLGFSASRTMRLAQELYEGLEVGAEGPVGLITYIRTDSVRVATEAQLQAREFIAANYGAQYVPTSLPVYRSKKGAQQAHEAIRPTSVNRTPESLKPYLKRDQLRLYRLVWERFVASQMTPAVFDTVTVDVTAGSYLLRANGATLKFAGFMRLYVEGQDESVSADDESAKEKDAGNGTDRLGQDKEQQLPPLNVGDPLYLEKLKPEQHFTQPPPRFTEASLIRTLEELGIGRPSTYAPTVATLKERDYVKLIDKHLEPTELGFVVVDLLSEHFPDIVDPKFTAQMEDQLDRVEEGNEDWVSVVRAFYEPFETSLAAAKKTVGRVELPVEETDVVCEQCGRKMVIKHGRYGRFLACPGYPECKNTKPLLKETGAHCPECGGRVVERRSKKGRVFYGCENYPRCEFTTWYQPAGKECPQCGKFLVRKRSRGRGEELVCVDEKCDYKEVPQGKGTQKEG